jgi:hypothetical protein
LRDIQKCAIDVGKIGMVTCGQVVARPLGRKINILTAYISDRRWKVAGPGVFNGRGT